MAETLTCARGHQTQITDGTSPPAHCSVCGMRLEAPALPKRSLDSLGQSLDSPFPAGASSLPPEPTVIPALSRQVTEPRRSVPLRHPDSEEYPQIPGYEILGELGHGGMGVVYRARDRQLGRLVAIKMILTGEHASAAQLLRFHLEAEAHAALQHPNIVQIYDVGEHQGCPYLVLEFVDGGTLSQQIAGQPQSPRMSANLIQTLAQAIHAAHLQGIVHRDLKPENILLQRNPNVSSGTSDDLLTTHFIPKISDFGLAKRLEQEDGTKTGSVLGTLLYMAPEQAAGRVREIGPGTDIYALGCLLYVLLTGKPPFEQGDRIQLMQRIQNEEPARPRSIRPEIPLDLDTICMKCLQKDRQQRYRSGEDLADDLGRFLSGEPILARPTSNLERFVMWAQRAPAAATLAGLAVILPLLLLGFLAFHHFRLQKERDDARDRLKDGFNAMVAMFTEFQDEWEGDGLEMETLNEPTLKKLLRLCDSFTPEKSADTENVRRRGQAWFWKGNIHRVLNQPTEAETAYRQAIVIHKSLIENEPTTLEYQHDLAESYNWLGELYRLSGKDQNAGQAYNDALAIQEKLAAPNQFERERELARTYYNLGVLAGKEIDAKSAERAAGYYQRAISLLNKWTGGDAAPDAQLQVPELRRWKFQRELARCYLNRGTLGSRLASLEPEKDYRDAIKLYQQAIKQVGQQPAVENEVAVVHTNFGNWLMRKERYHDALAEYEQATLILDRLVRNYPGLPMHLRELARTHFSIGNAHFEQGRFSQARFSWGEAERRYERLAQEYPHTSEYGVMLANLLAMQGELSARENQFEEGANLFGKAVARIKELIGRQQSSKDPKHYELLLRHQRGFVHMLTSQAEHAPVGHDKAVKAAHDYATLALEDREAGLGKAQNLFFAGCFIARSVRCAELDPTLSPEQRKSVANQYRQSSVNYLKRGLEAGYVLSEPLRKHKLLEGLQNYPDFETLCLEYANKRP